VQFLQEGGAHLNTMRGLRVQILNFSGEEYLLLVFRVSTGIDMEPRRLCLMEKKIFKCS
jgi:hypothetical protein